MTTRTFEFNAARLVCQCYACFVEFEEYRKHVEKQENTADHKLIKWNDVVGIDS